MKLIKKLQKTATKKIINLSALTLILLTSNAFADGIYCDCSLLKENINQLETYHNKTLKERRNYLEKNKKVLMDITPYKKTLSIVEFLTKELEKQYINCGCEGFYL